MSDCGNKVIDDLAMVGRMLSVWDRLLYRYPEIRRWADYIAAARRDGRVRRTIEGDARYAPLLRNPRTGPESDAEWDLLAEAALRAAATGRSVRMRRHDAGHEGELVPDRARGAFVQHNSCGNREVGVILTEHSWAHADDVLP